MHNNTLKHYGITGMKWGIRRFQNKDGTRTPAGKKRYDGDETPKKTTKEEPKQRTVKDLSDTELQARIRRLDLEKRYKDLSTSVNPPKSTRGKDFALRVIEKIGENKLVNIGTQAATKGLGELINKAFKVDSSDTVKRIVNPNKGQSDKK